MRPLVQWASAAVVCAVAVLAGFWAEKRRADRSLEPRPVYELPRTTKVLDGDDCAYLAKFYRSNVATWSQTYFNMLLHRWNNQDERMGAIFDKVIAAANRVDGGSGDYTITNDFFSFRAPGVVQFAVEGMYHTDCDFWKTKASDGFNLWVLIDHVGLDRSFEFLERSSNPGLYQGYDGKRSVVLVARNGSDPESPFRARLLEPVSFRRGHGDVLNWRGSLQVAVRKAFRAWSKRRRRKQGPGGAFDISALNSSRVKLAVGEALVLREQELHRTDLHTQMAEGQFRLVAGFKLQRRNSVLHGFDIFCTAQRDRFNIPALWEHIGMPMQQAYTARPGERLAHFDRTGKVLALARANSYSLLVLLLLGVAACGMGLPVPRTFSATAVAMILLLLLVVAAQWGWFIAGAEVLKGEGGRLRSSIE